MSDTPRTYAARMPINSHNYKHEVVHIDTCIELERENAVLREMHDNMLKIIATLTEDKERLDSGEIMLMVSDEKMRHVGRHKIDLRAAIDAARKEGQP